ncbi:MAG: quinone-dependent dihydroorotate dehydrogenase [Epsilonproteobacteria bacterium]|nr:dihydroorotate dehydrogenase (quinone) [Campylobacterota bacterium]NPA57128.1 quinone-dependent dihydroorotate dehydrogenase [Campylobacterota bacterium]
MEYQTVKGLLFRLDPESAHHLAQFFLELAGFIPPLLRGLERRFLVEREELTQTLFGREFRNPVGIAAGFDKDGTMVRSLHALGFGHVEVGTVTPKPQIGNPKPRLFRYPKYEAIQNAMGFNNDGAQVVAARLRRLYPAPFPIGVNIGKNKETPEEKSLDDYRLLIETFRDLADYLVVNISSPNTPGLRDLQNQQFIKELFTMASDLTEKPILLKIAPDMEPAQGIDLTATAVEAGAAGIIATNTSTDYSLLKGAREMGGISGKVIKEKSFALFDAIARELFGKTVLISVGGIDSPEEAYRRIRAGANLVQIYTAFIYGGPPLIREINSSLLEFLKRDGFATITEAIGADR